MDSLGAKSQPQTTLSENRRCSSSVASVEESTGSGAKAIARAAANAEAAALSGIGGTAFDEVIAKRREERRGGYKPLFFSLLRSSEGESPSYVTAATVVTVSSSMTTVSAFNLSTHRCYRHTE